MFYIKPCFILQHQKNLRPQGVLTEKLDCKYSIVTLNCYVTNECIASKLLYESI